MFTIKNRNKLALLSLLLCGVTLPVMTMADDATDRKVVASKSYVDTKQNRIAATSNGTDSSPNYVYDSSTNPTAAGSVVTTTTTPGTVGERGIATAPTYDSGNNLSNGSWLPTMGAVMTAISSAVPSGTANNVAMYDSNGDLGDGQPTANAATYNNDTLTNGNSIATIAAVETKQNQIAATSDGTDSSPNYVYDSSTNPTAAGSVVTTTDSAGVTGQRGIATAPTYDNNDTLSNGDWLPTMSAMMTAIANATPTISGTAGNVAMYDSNGDLSNGQPVASAATYSSDTLTNGNSIANIAAVETKVSKTQPTGYQILTTGTTGTVTAEYLAVPVTTSGTGRPAANNAPTGTAAIWIE